MSEDWRLTRLGDIVSIKHGWPFKSEHFSEELSGRPIVVAVGNFRYDGGFRFQETGIKEYRDSYPEEFELSAGDILLIMTCQTQGGEILGIPARIPDDGRRYLHNQRLGKVEIKSPESVDPGFLYQLFKSRAFNAELCATASGSKILHTAPSRIEAFEFACPPIVEQRAIASVLGALDDKIEQNRHTARALERLAQAIFRAWFVDFEPVKAKAAGATSFPSMPQDVFVALPVRFVDSEIGPVPEGWEVKPIGEAVSVKGGATPSTKNPEYWEGGIHCWATPKDMSRLSHPVLLDTERRITDVGVKCISSGMLPKGTVLMSSRAPVGYLAIAGVPTAINQGFIAMVCDGPLPPTYILHWAHASMEAIHARASGTTFPEISKKNFRSLPVIVPSKPVIYAFHETADLLFDLLVACIKENLRLVALRDYLLPRLLNGSVRVKADNG